LTLKVFITGASSGIGEALAVYYAAQGATLGLAARRADALAALNQRLGGGHACYALDVTDAPALHAAAADFIGRFGAPDIVIANAGVSAGTLTEHEEDLAVFRRVMDINVFGMAATFAPFIPAIKAAGGAGHKMQRLVGIASVAGIRGLPGAEAYSASKAAAIAYLESLRLEMRPYGIKVVTIAPGYIETPMTEINPYKMPFLLPVDRAAERFAAAIARGTSYLVIPWQMGIVAKLLRALPNWLYDRLFTSAPRKPRGLLK
jgi:hypothetical protein